MCIMCVARQRPRNEGRSAAKDEEVKSVQLGTAGGWQRQGAEPAGHT